DCTALDGRNLMRKVEAAGRHQAVPARCPVIHRDGPQAFAVVIEKMCIQNTGERVPMAELCRVAENRTSHDKPYRFRKYTKRKGIGIPAIINVAQHQL